MTYPLSGGQAKNIASNHDLLNRQLVDTISMPGKRLMNIAKEAEGRNFP